MIGNILAPFEEVYVPPFDPDSMFDSSNTATEENFIQLLEHGVYDSKYIGYYVKLTNSVEYNNKIQVIADVNHDSTNTGQTNCYDLISENCFYSVAFGSNQNWRSSIPRTWLNDTFYPGFSTEFKNHLLNPKYNSQNAWYTDDKIILPSKIEVNGGLPSTNDEGVAYPIFTDNASRKKYQTGSTATSGWRTRSSYIDTANNVWCVTTGGKMGGGNYSSSRCLAPILRVQ